jgi:hypothetical protein
MYRTAPSPKEEPSKMSTVWRLRMLELDDSCHHSFNQHNCVDVCSVPGTVLYSYIGFYQVLNDEESEVRRSDF